MEPIPTPSSQESRRATFEVRPSPLRQWNPDAPDEIVFTDGKKRGFGDLLQALNPLHHIPVVGTLYREITGATIEPAARVIGGLVFGGPAGLASALVNGFVEDASGKDLGGHIASLVMPAGSDPRVPAPPQGDAPAEGSLFLASATSVSRLPSGASVESDGLLATWIANGAPRPEPALEARAPAPTPGTDLGRPAASHLPLFTPLPSAPTPAPAPAPAAAPASAPVQAAAAPQAAPTGSEFLPLAGRGRSLAEYRAAAHAVPLGAMRTPVPSDPLAFQRNGPRTLANYRADAAAAATLPAPLEAQRQADPAQATSPEQSWIAAMMGAGLDRYRETQRRRDESRPAQERL